MADANAVIEQARNTPPTNNKDKTPVLTMAQQLEAARTSLRSLEERLKPSHPDVIRVKRLISDLETKVAEEEKAGVTHPPTLPMGPSAAANRLASLRLETDQLRRSLETRKGEDERLKKMLATYTAKLDATPKLESELAVLTRDYETLQGQYGVMLKKSEDSKMAASLERRQIGEQFKIIETARIPERPISPDRVQLNLVGLFVGLGVGLALVGLLEYRDTTLKTDDDIIVSLALPVLAVIPAMLTRTDRRRIRRRRVIVALSASLATILVAAAIFAWRPGLLQAWGI
jgi:uncharacterized protein involved in exopolysaccharide biosynthesis